MTDPVSAIRQGCGSAIPPSPSCKKDQCTVVLDKKLPLPRVLVDMDHHSLGFQNTQHCDYLFVAGTNDCCWVVPIELTSGRNKTLLKAIEQLQTGADLAHHNLPESVKACLQPVIAARALKRAESGQIRKKVKFRGQSAVPERISCGDSLSRALR